MAAFQTYIKSMELKMWSNELRYFNFADIPSQQSLDFIKTQEWEISKHRENLSINVKYFFAQTFLLVLGT